MSTVIILGGDEPAGNGWISSADVFEVTNTGEETLYVWHRPSGSGQITQWAVDPGVGPLFLGSGQLRLTPPT